MPEEFLQNKLNERKNANAFRSLIYNDNKVDFCSNDYLGIVKNNLLLSHGNNLKYGSTGSRLLSGNYPLIEQCERSIADFHNAAAGLIFNSGYDANIGLMASVPQKNDVIIYDQLVHASIRDGIRLSFATAFQFPHNDVEALEIKLSKLESTVGNKFVVTESVFSMDGDVAPLALIADLCEKYNAHLVIDEAHATGVIGKKGEGVVQTLSLQKKCFARVHTFGKACGTHGAIVLGSNDLRNYLINFARPFIYSTALPETTVASIKSAYEIFPGMSDEREQIKKLIEHFQKNTSVTGIQQSNTPIQVVIVSGNENVKAVCKICEQNDIDVRPILYPTVPRGKERLRIVLHSFNTIQQVDALLNIISS